MRKFPSFEIKDAVIQKIKDLFAEGRMCSLARVALPDAVTGNLELQWGGVNLEAASFCFMGVLDNFFCDGDNEMRANNLLVEWGWNGDERTRGISLNNRGTNSGCRISRLDSVEPLLNYLQETEVGNPE